MNPTRLAFAELMASIQSGIDKTEAIRILGEPDCILTTRWRENILFPNGTKETLCYGVENDLPFPTLGHLYVNSDNRIYMFDPPPMPSDNLTLPETAIRKSLRMLDSIPSLNGDTFNPLGLIRVANFLIRLGQKHAVESIREFLRLIPKLGVYPPSTGLFLLIRALFNIPRGMDHIPYPFLGASTPNSPANRILFPRFPLIIENDIPFLVIDTYRLLGHGSNVRDELDELNRISAMRKELLKPTPHLKYAFDLVTRQEVWAELVGPQPECENDMVLRSRFANQLLRLVSTVGAFTILLESGGVSRFIEEDHFQQMAEFETVLTIAPLQWNEKKDVYLLADIR